MPLEVRERAGAAAHARSRTRFEEEAHLARRPNYGFQKRQKELNRQARKEQKAERKRVKKEAEGAAPEERTPDPSPEDRLPEATEA